jgi:toxin ParE1/3/4
MQVVWTEAALADLDEVLAYTAEHYPSLVDAIEHRVRAVVMRVGQWPESARIVEERLGVRVAPLVRYPYREFYSVHEGQVEILHVHHAARDH